jgi:phosphoglycerate dehydrogenase-like enzyme
MTTVSILDDDTQRAAGFAKWDALDDGIILNFLRRIEDEDALVHAVSSSDVIVVMRERTRIDSHLLDRLPMLRLIVTTGMANTAIDLDATAERGITVVGTASSGKGVIELAWALILVLTKRLAEQEASLRRGSWQTALSGNLDGRTLGLIGFGRLGQGMLPVANAFGMRVIAWSPNLDKDQATGLGVTPVTREALFAEADVLSIHTRLSERTTGLVGAPELASMKSTALLINTSRGPIVDEVALIDALIHGTIGGAGLDVFNEEPLPAAHPLCTTPNTVLVPHLGYASEDNIAMMYREAVDDIAAYLSGTPIRVVRAPR